MPNIWIKKNGKEYGEYEMIDDNNDLKILIELYLGREVGNLVQELIDATDEMQRGVDTDLETYEFELEDMHSAFYDVLEIAEKLTKELNGEKRVEKKDIISRLNEIVKIARSQ